MEKHVYLYWYTNAKISLCRPVRKYKDILGTHSLILQVVGGDEARLLYSVRAFRRRYMRRRMLLFAGFVTRMGEELLPKRVMFGEIVGGEDYSGGQEWTVVDEVP